MYMVIDTGYVVIENSNINAITTIGTGGNIISEKENSKVKWNIGTATGTYIIPFTTATGMDINFTFDITSAGTGTGDVTLSSYPTPDGNCSLPTGVTNFDNGGGTDDSLFAADRFWLIDVNNYTVNPTATVIFKYDVPTDLKPNNTITEANLQAQRWNGSNWELPQGTVNTVSNTVAVTGINNFSPWVLVDNSSPLPVELLYFTARWQDDVCEIVQMEWATATEINNDYFEIQRSTDGINFTAIKQEQGAGNSNTIIVYTETNVNPVKDISYYRLKQVDFNGEFSYSNIAIINAPEGINIINLWPNPSVNEFTFLLTSSENTKLNIAIVDMQGKTVKKITQPINESASVLTIDTRQLLSGYYFRLSSI